MHRSEERSRPKRHRFIWTPLEEATTAVLERLDPARRRLFGRLLRWAQDAAPVREDALADVGLAWPVMRRMLLELGRRLVEAEAVERAADVFWLRREEVEKLASFLDAGETRPGSLSEAGEQRKMLWRGQRRVTPPQLLPKGTWVELFRRWMPAVSEEQTGNTIKGIAASGGWVTAPAHVLSGPEDFGQMRAGEVLVAGITTPAWTPLFAMASAVVTDVGGPLSHSSIVAREYGIPAVLGTGVATRRIRNGQNIRVDGDTGTVTLLDGTDSVDSKPPDATRPSPPSKATKIALSTLFGVAVISVLVRRKRRKRT
jgi:pyruvate,water dikinase